MTDLDLMDSLPRIAGRIDQSQAILLGLDFDGTLTPLRQHPGDAVLTERVRALLGRLARVPRVTLMIVSGRSLVDVAGRVGLPELIYAGNHGLEIEGPGVSFVEPTAAALADRLRELTGRLEPLLAEIPGALVEPKGLTTSVHYRNVPPEHTDRLARIVRETVEADTTRFVLTTGHAVWEIRPPVRWRKGDALLWVVRQLKDGSNRLVFFLGDDRTDEDAFASLPDHVTVKIGSPDHPTLARYRLRDPDAVHAFLEWLADRLIKEARDRNPCN
jgi:trehalose 6-phosphate phosphatase